MLLTVLFPGLSLIIHQRPGLGSLVVILQLTLVGWPIGTVVAGQHLHRQRRRQRRSGHWGTHSFFAQLLY
jgi:hypothetical protein